MIAKVFITGASGFVGFHLLQKLSELGFTVTCLLRKNSVQHFRKLNLKNVSIIEGNFTQVNEWAPQLKNHDIYINTVGIIRENGTSTFKTVHELAPIEAFKKCREFGVKKIIQLSALGADENAKSQYHLSKRAADKFLAELGIPFAILRPSFIYGPNDQSMSFFSSLATLPVHLLPSHGGYRLSPLYINDLINVFLSSIKAQENKILDLGGPDTISYKELLSRLSKLLGQHYFIQLSVPAFLINISCRITDHLKVGPINSEEWSMLQRENFCSSKTMERQIGFLPTNFETGIHSTQQVYPYHFAHFKWLVPFLRWTMAFIWIHTGVISLFFTPKEFSLQLLHDVGVMPPYAEPILYFTAGFEIILGLSILLKKCVGLTTLIQLFLIFSFTLILSTYSPEFWIHPFGPLSKNVPLISAILVLWVFEKKRQVELV